MAENKIKKKSSRESVMSCLHRSVDLALDMWNNLALGLWSLKKNHPLSAHLRVCFMQVEPKS